MSESEPLRIGLIGAGMIGRLRAAALARIDGAELVAVADPDTAARQAAITASGTHPRPLGDGLAIAEEPAIDAVILATPPHLHARLGLACLEAGKHLLVEKPLARTVAEAEALVEAAEKRGLCLATGFTLRQTRAARRARRLVDEGTIGTIDHVRAVHGHGGEELHAAWLRDPRLAGGGTLMDNGIHMIDLARWFLGEIAEAHGLGTGRVWGREGLEDNGFLLLRSIDGRVGTVHSSWTEWRGYGYRLEIYGTRGFVRFGYPPLWLCWARGEPGSTMRKRWELFPGYQLAERVRGWEWGLVETLVHDLEGWLDAIAKGEPAPASGRDGLEAVRIARSIERLGTAGGREPKD